MARNQSALKRDTLLFMDNASTPGLVAQSATIMQGDKEDIRP